MLQRFAGAFHPVNHLPTPVFGPLSMRVPIIKTVCSFSMLTALASQGWAQENVLLGRGASGDALYVTVLNNTLPTPMVRIRLLYAGPQTIANVKDVLASESVEQIDCRNMTHTVMRYELYTSLVSGSAPVLAIDIDSSGIKPLSIDPGTESASTLVFRSVCSVTGLANKTHEPPRVALVKPIAQDSTRPPPPPAESVPPSMPARRPPSPQEGRPDEPIPTQPRTPSQTPTSPQPTADNPTKQQPAPGSTSPLNSDSTIASQHPFPESSFTLGVMGGLAEFVYLDEATLAFHEAVTDKIARGRQWAARDSKQHPLLDEAYRRSATELEHYREGMKAKEVFLMQHQLKPLPLPKIAQQPIKTFRAELYQHMPTGETILVFRGTQGGLDWLTNLWTGVDLFSLEAPHYRAAYDLVAALRKQKMNPIVVGHSLGGGMAQYVGYKFGLKVVGFNSAPLPQRYYSGGDGTDIRYIRLFSAIETVDRPGMAIPDARPDPVSIILPDQGASINKLFPNYEPIKAHQHLVKPICVRTTLQPFYTATEERELTSMINGVLSKGVVSAVVGGIIPKPGAVLTDKAMVENIRAHVNAELSDPVWQPDSRPNIDNKGVAEAAKNGVAQVAVDGYKTLGGTTAIAKGGYKVAFGNSWGDTFAGLGALAGAAGKVALVNYLLTHGLLPHSMTRFNRAMQATANRDVFLAEPIRAQCQTTVTTY